MDNIEPSFDIRKHMGEQIKYYRKMKKMTLQQLADDISKSRATVSKYENGEISIDVETLIEISEVLGTEYTRLVDYKAPIEKAKQVISDRRSPFYMAEKLYFYFYDGRIHGIRDGVIEIAQEKETPGQYTASLTIRTSLSGRNSQVMEYRGRVIYGDMIIRFTFENEYNALEEDLLYIFNPLEKRDYTEGLICGISSSDYRPCAFKCLVTLTPASISKDFESKLLFSKNDIKKFQQLNMFMIDNQC